MRLIRQGRASLLFPRIAFLLGGFILPVAAEILSQPGTIGRLAQFGGKLESLEAVWRDGSYELAFLNRLWKKFVNSRLKQRYRRWEKYQSCAELTKESLLILSTRQEDGVRVSTEQPRQRKLLRQSRCRAILTLERQPSCERKELKQLLRMDRPARVHAASAHMP